MFRIRRFGVVRTATVVAVAYAIAFAIVLVPFAILALALGERSGAVSFGAILMVGVLLLVVYPLLIWIATALACLVYNLAARWVGGIEVQVERSPEAWGPPGQDAWRPPPHGQAPWSPQPPPSSQP